MRNLLTSGLAVLLLAACGQGDGGSATSAAEPADAAAVPAAAAGMPQGPTPGLWRVTTRMAGMPEGAASPAIETCIRVSTFQPPQVRSISSQASQSGFPAPQPPRPPRPQ